MGRTAIVLMGPLEIAFVVSKVGTIDHAVSRGRKPYRTDSIARTILAKPFIAVYQLAEVVEHLVVATVVDRGAPSEATQSAQPSGGPELEAAGHLVRRCQQGLVEHERITI